MQIPTCDNRLTKRQMVNQAVLDHGECLNPKKDPSKRNTLTYELSDGTKIIRYHWTDVIEMKPDGRVIIKTNGYDTVTTRRRINDASQEYKLFLNAYQSNWVTYINNIPVFDGMVFLDGIWRGERK